MYGIMCTIACNGYITGLSVNYFYRDACRKIIDVLLVLPFAAVESKLKRDATLGWIIIRSEFS